MNCHVIGRFVEDMNNKRVTLMNAYDGAWKSVVYCYYNLFFAQRLKCHVPNLKKTKN